MVVICLLGSLVLAPNQSSSTPSNNNRQRRNPHEPRTRKTKADRSLEDGEGRWSIVEGYVKKK